MRMFSTVLVANRGEIACRVIRTLRELGIRSVAVYSDADAGARHVALADEAVRLGPAPAALSYLDIDAVIAAARATGAEAIHPGYGFLSENTVFAAACEEAGIVFIGPSADAIRTMGDKIAAKHAVEARGVPTVPGVARAGMTDAELIAAAPEVGYPLLIKPSAGGGGKGMHVVTDAADLPAALAAARREAGASFGDDTLFLERYVDTPRHIEVQVLADAHGTVVHLGERECSLQRRHQKVIEEAPSPLLDEATRARIGQAACETARSVDYRGAGTVEFIVAADRPDEFFFMEMNTRLQVEHPVTEEVTGVDLVAAQLRIAAGEPLGFGQDEVVLTGHSIEARVYAEDPAAGFLPTGGRVVAVRHPAGPGIRVDSALADGLDVSVDYDPMLAKVIATGATRDEARRRLVAALGETAVLGFETNIPFLRALLELPAVAAGHLDTGLIARELDGLVAATDDAGVFVEAALLMDAAVPRTGDPWRRADGWRLGPPVPRRYGLACGGEEQVVELVGDGVIVDGAVVPASARRIGDPWMVRIGDRSVSAIAVVEGDGVWLSTGGRALEVRRTRLDHRRDADASAVPELVSPMPGVVVMTSVADGAEVSAGDPVVVVEAMKMEHVVRAEVAGTVALRVSTGDSVGRGQTLAVVTPTAEEVA
ncbi:acetyl-CoA carboxylase biotin carboxylase subunit [Microbacterium sp. EYE_5]|uniref:acetyl/propionyl/methylcrotonyl-CoA carboxylase subunit alpha n=1 Tax=unclassified Microbacterium TaxID=2609290 RepID=UPI0020047F8F|nr:MULTISPECIES: acetyl-CoA carboxylase biotin carboxylase subunit [unclassified Microbacterium]MCK6079892.1 acetyl-CoA carboxylase biotin carboxylase subunit [Microbacterium sp. EYE_382]MCK6085163.1 acetyl-CoA carboxylase biotin carboxylase subunit [Microbacterium sp. EYE_384]MCK6122611.1 acetyl-CoA carboxylase biotin carboxylase subunit [Microbacterium sp. EYE_80]MCK6125926.1 acetyl-CoA carboxylase biotin carboxylase subunit [Microbacterium sp. EYE_79]MCK6140847.1 acetyl-CoA carboxylase biot